MTTRAEHVRWCKQRALEYIELGQPDQAYASMVSDMGKHDETVAVIQLSLAGGMAALRNEGSGGVRRWIEGFGE